MRIHPVLRAFLPLFLSLPICAASQAQIAFPTPPAYPNAFARPISANRGAAALQDDLVKLRTRASLVMVTAHPDDEDGGLLAYESRHEGANTSLLTLNRGEGGQNEMSSSYWDELGLLRTQELLAADQYYGVHQYWTRAADFGFSKTLEESMEAWGHDRVLYDVVRILRITRPLVVTSVFIGNVSDGHGQHQVSGEMAQEAYKAAGDPNVFPDQIRAGLRPWSPLKVYARTPFARFSSKGIYDYATGHWAPARFRNYVNGTWIEGVPSATVEVPEGQYAWSYGLSYLQLGREGLDEQKSQHGGIGFPLPGPSTTPYHLYASQSALPAKEAGFFDGLDVSLKGIAGYAPAAQRPEWTARLESLQSTVQAAWTAYSAGTAEKVAPVLADGLSQTNLLLADLASSSLPDDVRYNMTHELQIKQQQFNQALTDALGLDALAVVASTADPKPDAAPEVSESTFQIAIPGQQFDVRVHLANQGSEDVVLRDARISTNGDPGWKIAPRATASGPLEAAKARNFDFSVVVPPRPALTRPYFSRPTIEQPYYDIGDPLYLGLPTSYYPLSAELTIAYRNVEVRMTSVVQTVHRITGPGPVLEPLLTGPPISLWLSAAAGVVPLAKPDFRLEVAVHSNVLGPAKGPATGTVRLQLPQGWTSEPVEASFATAHDGEDSNLTFQVHCGKLDTRSYTIHAIAEYNGEKYSEGYRTVGYTGLRPYPYYRPATYRAAGVDLKVAPGLKIGYIMGTGDDVPRSLADLGVAVDLLSPQDLATANLSAYSTIVVGIRAYAVRPELPALNGRILEYVKQGGVLLVEYQTPEYDHNYGPYPLALGDNPEKVVDEAAKVAFLNPTDPLFSWPNKIDSADFSGWVEERGHDFLTTWDPRYIALTEVHDPDQDPQKGGLLYAHYGRGVYVYAAYAFYRQLPEGVPGAFRILANLLSLSKNPGLATGNGQ